VSEKKNKTKSPEEEKREKTKLFEELMGLLGAAYGKTFEALGMRAYHMVLGGLTQAQLKTAFTRAMREERFCPSPATVKAYAPPAKQELESAEECTPITPWTTEQVEEARGLFKRLVDAVTPEESKESTMNQTNQRNENGR
jgi:hypothetical protein